MRTRGRAAIVVVAAVALTSTVACSKDTPHATVGPASSSDRVASIAPTTAPTTSAPETTTTAPATCNAAAPAGSLRSSQVSADLDGDGTPDTATVYATGTDQAPSPYRLRVDLGGDRGSTDALIADAGVDASQTVRVLGAAEISASSGLPPEGSGAELFLAVGAGAASAVVGVFQVSGCTITRVTAPGSAGPSMFPIGGTVTSLGGLRCDGTAGGQRLVVLTAESTDGITYQTTAQRLDITNGAFVASGPPVTGSMSATDPGLQDYSRLDCPGVASP